MKYRGIIFDFNGTLFEDTRFHVAAWDEMRMSLEGEHVTEEIMDKEYSGMPNVETLKKMTNNTKSIEELNELSKKKEELYRKAVSNMEGGPRLNNGAPELFDRLQEEGIPFTIASSSIRENIDFFVEIFHLDQWINPENIVYDNGTYPNKVQMFLDAKKKIGLKQDDPILIFEDSLSGIRSAEKTGADIIAIKRASLVNQYKEYSHIIAVIDDFDEAEQYLF